MKKLYLKSSSHTSLLIAWLVQNFKQICSVLLSFWIHFNRLISPLVPHYLPHIQVWKSMNLKLDVPCVNTAGCSRMELEWVLKESVRVFVLDLPDRHSGPRFCWLLVVCINTLWLPFAKCQIWVFNRCAGRVKHAKCSFLDVNLQIIPF